ncbi:MAG: MaoC family dehydratase [Candidatus Limnocylindria bacterium]
MNQGRFLEDFKVGDVYRSPTGRTITQADNIWFSLLTNNQNPIHIDEHYASQTEFKRPLVNSILTIGVVTGLMVPDTSQNGFALGWDEITLPTPLFQGDTLYADSEVLDIRESKSRRGWGIVKVRQRGFKPDGTVVLVMIRSFMVPTRAEAPRRDPPTPKD